MKNSDKPVIAWLLTGCFLIFLMVVIGGITRLTLSGLSIVEWDLLMGTLPPVTSQDWQELFQKYQQSPQYQLVNIHFGLEEFKSIFWWEYIHRLLGRMIGLVFFFPFIYFLIKKKLSLDLIGKLLVIFVLGGLQGFLGWYMVKSGLVKDPHISHYRLAAHLVTAFVSFGFTFWVALGLIYPQSNKSQILHGQGIGSVKKLTYVLSGVVFLQIIYGAFVAGLKAGMVYNTFPKMGSEWMAEGVTAMQPFWKNLLESIAGVQFVHRYLAYIVVIIVGIIWFKARNIGLSDTQKGGINFLGIAVIIQFLLGVFTLLYAVPVALGVIHQVGAFFLFAAVIYLLHQLRQSARSLHQIT